MLKKILSRLWYRRYPWRAMDFDQVSELYVSMMLRRLGLSLVGIFIPVYLYQLGYSLSAVFLFLALFNLFRVVMDFVAAFLVARYGPKHIMALSYVVQIVSLAMLMTLPSLRWPIPVLSLTSGAASSLFFIAYHVDFSKVKHRTLSGRQLGVMEIMERIGAALGPLVGGIVAVLFDVRYTFFIAVVFFAIALVPLFISSEPIRTGQRLNFRTFKLNRYSRDLVAVAGFAVDGNITILGWPLFVAIFIAGSDPYAEVGLITSLAIAVSMFSARLIGDHTDKQQGRALLRFSAFGNTVVSGARLLASSMPFAAFISMANELFAAGYRIPFHKGMYDRADSIEGRRIVYITCVEAFGDSIRSLVWFLLAILSTGISGWATFAAAFIINAFANMLITAERFPALSPKGTIWNRNA